LTSVLHFSLLRFQSPLSLSLRKNGVERLSFPFSRRRKEPRRFRRIVGSVAEPEALVVPVDDLPGYHRRCLRFPFSRAFLFSISLLPSLHLPFTVTVLLSFLHLTQLPLQGLWNAMNALGAGGGQQPFLVNAAKYVTFIPSPTLPLTFLLTALSSSA
jgi:hypothetical protein